jgi:two-component system cell cycle response regulator
LKNDSNKNDKDEKVISKISLITIKDILDNVATGVYFVSPDRLILYWNKAAEEITGFSENVIVGKKCFDTPLRHLDDAGENLCIGRCPLVEAIEKEERVEKKVWVHTKNEGLKHIIVKTIPMRDRFGDLIGAIETFDDISELDKLEVLNKKLKMLSTRDSLTNLYNKREMLSHLKKALAKAKRGKCMYAMLLDLNGFKNVNDKCGHMEGDKIIKEFSEKIQNVIREDDEIFRPTTSRFGGDEFVIILETDCSSDVSALLKRLDDIKQRTFVKSCVGNIGTAIGITKIHEDDDIDMILNRADKAMYKSKKENKVVFLDKHQIDS